MEEIELIGRKFKKMHHIIESMMNKEMASADLTKSQVDVLIYLIKNRDKDISGRDIEKYFNLTNPTITGILNRLELKGFIIRETNPLDARGRHIKITQKAIENKENAKKIMCQIHEKIFEDISKEEIATVNLVLDKMLNNIS